MSKEQRLENTQPPVETIIFPGVSHPLPKYWSKNKIEAIYYCHMCQTPPPNPNPKKKIVVSVTHDACGQQAIAGGLTKLSIINHYLEVQAGIIQDQNANLILDLDSDAEI